MNISFLENDTWKRAPIVALVSLEACSFLAMETGLASSVNKFAYA